LSLYNIDTQLSNIMKEFLKSSKLLFEQIEFCLILAHHQVLQKNQIAVNAALYNQLIVA